MRFPQFTTHSLLVKVHAEGDDPKRLARNRLKQYVIPPFADCVKSILKENPSQFAPHYGANDQTCGDRTPGLTSPDAISHNPRHFAVLAVTREAGTVPTTRQRRGPMS